MASVTRWIRRSIREARIGRRGKGPRKLRLVPRTQILPKGTAGATMAGR